MTRRRRAGQPEPRRRLRQPGRPCRASRPIRATWASRRSRPAGSTARSAIRRSFTYSRQPALRAVRQRHARPRRAPPEVRRLLLPPAASGPSSPTTRAAPSPTPGSSAGNAFADFLLGYPTSAVVGHRPRRRGRPHQLAAPATRRTTGEARDNLTLNLGLRYEYNQHMYDVDNRLSSVDFATPGGRFVIASDDDGTIDPERAGAAAADARSPT